MLLILPFIVPLVSANLFDFFGNGFQQQQQQGGHQQYNPAEHEVRVLNNGCSKYLCQDTQACVESPNDCPCPFPNSQLRCVLPNGGFMCISKPAGEAASLYDDENSNHKVDAGDDNIRDCGWVTRAYNGLV